jgi:hypothetical protein
VHSEVVVHRLPLLDFLLLLFLFLLRLLLFLLLAFLFSLLHVGLVLLHQVLHAKTVVEEGRDLFVDLLRPVGVVIARLRSCLPLYYFDALVGAPVSLVEVH